MNQGLAETAEYYPLQVRKFFYLAREQAKNLHLHMSLRIFPDVANTGPAVEIAIAGRLHIELMQVRLARKQNNGALPLIEPPFPAQRKAPAVLFRQPEGAVFPQNNFRHLSS